GFKMDNLLMPLESEINFAPYTPAELKAHIAILFLYWGRVATNEYSRPGRRSNFAAICEKIVQTDRELKRAGAALAKSGNRMAIGAFNSAGV
ncbi:hypothetical protein ACC698_37165, partial [Rhizobium johnstonii]